MTRSLEATVLEENRHQVLIRLIFSVTVRNCCLLARCWPVKPDRSNEEQTAIRQYIGL